ncbi:MAG: YciI family protein [Paracoccus denitrificans]|uniref:YciI family protein n=1 Tax=Paracoccus denitrificans TaxID=266 RepID=A0A533I6J3_PARDE|nr:MAG: YciI family protein [Paracoccus denitrificans]
MPYFAVTCRDKPDALPVRMENRAAHLAYVEETGAVFIGGPLLEDGQMAGSMLVLDVADLDAAKAWAAADPYAKAGLFGSVTINEWKKVIG